MSRHGRPARVAVLGAGWAGLTCALDLQASGLDVCLYESAQHVGGRARRLQLSTPQGEVCVDNGQHILIGAYVRTLARMESLGLVPAKLLHRQALDLRFLDGRGLALGDAPQPISSALALWRAKGWTLTERWSLIRAGLGWALSGWSAPPSQTVDQLSAALPQTLRTELIEPLCVAALNTPAKRASAQVFLRVLHDAFLGPGGAGWRASDLLLPRADLSALLPDAALARLRAQGAEVTLGRPVIELAHRAGAWQLDGQDFDAVVLACSQASALRLARSCALPDASAWAEHAQALRHESIATVYTLQPGATLPRPMVALQGAAQYVFDRGQLGGPSGLWAWVVSAAGEDRQMAQDQVVQQALSHGLGRPTVIQTVLERRATFACEAGLIRPPMGIAPGLVAAGDYLEGPYPATLEGAVRSGEAAAARVGDWLSSGARRAR